MITEYRGFKPEIGEGVFIADTARVVGRVRIGRESSIWYGAVLRGDTNSIEVGKGTNIQDGSILHVDPDYPLVIGDYVTIGHRAVVHGCKVGSGSLIGIGSVLLSGCEIGEECFVAAGALVTPSTKAPARSLIMGSPAKVVREVGEKELAMMKSFNNSYLELRKHYLRAL